MKCDLYNNRDSDAIRNKLFEFDTFAQKYPMGPARSKAVDDLPWLIVCDGQFHTKTKGRWGLGERSAERVICRCPQHAGFVAVTKTKELSPEKQKEMTFETFVDPHRHVAEIKAWIAGKDQILLIFGDVGRGKTHLAKASQYFLVEQGRSVEMLTATYLAELFADAQPYRDDIQTRTDAKRRINRLITADCLIIDDLGLESNTQTFAEGLQGVLDGMRGRLIVTTNLRIDRTDMSQSLYRYGDRIFSRIHSGAESIRLKGGDFRKRIL